LSKGKKEGKRHFKGIIGKMHAGFRNDGERSEERGMVFIGY
jgi:hypothetical protein